MGTLDEIEAMMIVIDEGTIFAIKVTITFISINFDNVSRAMILVTESAKKCATSSEFLCCLFTCCFLLGRSAQECPKVASECPEVRAELV